MKINIINMSFFKFINFGNSIINLSHVKSVEVFNPSILSLSNNYKLRFTHAQNKPAGGMFFFLTYNDKFDVVYDNAEDCYGDFKKIITLIESDQRCANL